MLEEKNFLNIDENLHIDTLKSQYKVFNIVLERMKKDVSNNYYILYKELCGIKLMICLKEAKNKIKTK